MSTAELAAKGFSADTLGRLARQGLISFRQEIIDRDPFESSALSTVDADASRELTLDQESALKRLTKLAAAGAFRAVLLHGVTGSGKTELYVRLAAAQRARGLGTIVLVPEIALTPATAATFRQAFGDRVAIQHSGLSDGERHDQWQRIRRGDVDVVVGTRSAVFAPIARLGLIVVDEEHDTSYKQEESPRYNGRDVAIVRAQRAGALVVLGSATPSMETYQNAVSGKFEHIVLSRRVMDRALASVTIVDMREEYAAGGPDVILSRALAAGMAQRVARGEQSVVLLNRRGFATAAFCRQCAGTVDCPNCSVSLVIHGEGSARRARCHYCNYTSRVPQACPICAAPYMEQAGFGTERVEAEVKRQIPTARVARLDRDSVRRKGSLTALLSRFRDGEIDVLVGTQMIAKGHDFPRVTLVGVVSADVGLGSGGFPGVRAHVSADHPGGRTCRPRRLARRSHRADDLSRSLQHPTGLSAGLPGVFCTRDEVPPGDAVSATGVADQRRRARADVHGGNGRCRGDRSAVASGRVRVAATFECWVLRRRRLGNFAANTAFSSCSRARIGNACARHC